MESTEFVNYFEKQFLEFIDSNHSALLIYDGYYISNKLIDKVRESNVSILRLLAHTSHLLQPLDISIFKALNHMTEKKILEPSFQKNSSQS